LSFHRLLPSISFLKSDRRITAGSPHPLGATWDGRGTNFALFSSSAEKVELCLFDKTGRNEVDRVALPERTDDVWHAYLPYAQPGQLYGYRVHGPHDPEHGFRFNHHKLLVDPYSKRFGGQFTWTDAHLAYRVGNKREDLSFDRRDNARSMLKSVVVDQAYTWNDDRHPRVAWEDTIIYEAHVKGLTQLCEDIPQELRGTYRGLAAPAMIEHLHKLGVTAVELLPIHSFLDEPHLLDLGLKNYWGYNTLSFFAPEQRYAADNIQNAFRSTVAELHSAGIEVILDVVYNHTCEGNHLGPTLCYRGIDNAAYYWLVPDKLRFYENYTGTGNALNLSHPRVLQMVMDSLRYWVEAFHVDGFRFDLASTLGRTPEFNPHAAFFAAIRQDPVLANVKLVAEPWDIGAGGYQVGGFPPGWSEWNDVYRKLMRRYWRGEGDLLGDVAGSLTGSAAQFRHNGRGPQASINHVTVHDGFTLADLVSYENKHNEANKEDNRDGSDDNLSLNCGFEGPTKDGAILERRRLLRRNQLASLLLAQGVPLILAGDEVGNTQNGNNNAYCQDDEIGWVGWSSLGNGDDMTEFIGGLTQLRRRFAQLRSRHWLEGRRADGSHDVLWLRPDAAEMKEEDWRFPEGRFLAYVLAPLEQSGEPLFVAFNASSENIEVTLPEWQGVGQWSSVLDTVGNSVLQETNVQPPGTKLGSPPSSVLAFAGKP
jgi:glycogen operon protein